jgi:hypothetical protein
VTNELLPIERDAPAGCRATTTPENGVGPSAARLLAGLSDIQHVAAFTRASC